MTSPGKAHERTCFGPVTVVRGQDGGTFPHCTSLIVDGGSERAVIDPGAGPGAFAQGPVGPEGIDLVVNTHYHFDHIRGNHLFGGAAVLLNPVERECLPDLRAIGTRLGLRHFYGDAGVEEWIRIVSGETDPSREPGPLLGPEAPHTPAFRPEWWLATRRTAGAYPYGDFSIGRVRLVMVHCPGHTAGFCCPFFPDEGLVYTGDVDLTRFGPWYAGTDGDPDTFVTSARALLELDAEWYLTGHQMGLFRKEEFAEGLEDYLRVIEDRDRHISRLLEEGVPPGDITRRGPIYPSRFHVDPWVRMWDAITVEKHLARLGRARAHANPAN